MGLAWAMENARLQERDRVANVCQNTYTTFIRTHTHTAHTQNQWRDWRRRLAHRQYQSGYAAPFINFNGATTLPTGRLRTTTAIRPP